MTTYDNSPFTGCDGCAGTGGRAGCALHGGTSFSTGGVAIAAAVAHRHRWVFDGELAGGVILYHCDDHDPPVVSRVWPGATSREQADREAMQRTYGPDR